MADVIRSIFLYTWQNYDYVIFVRYLMGTAYLPPPLHKIAYHFFALFVPKSNAMFFLDTTPNEAYRRIRRTRKNQEMFEGINELRKVRVKGLLLALVGKWTIIDANKSIKEVGMEIQKLLGVS